MHFAVRCIRCLWRLFDALSLSLSLFCVDGQTEEQQRYRARFSVYRRDAYVYTHTTNTYHTKLQLTCKTYGIHEIHTRRSLTGTSDSSAPIRAIINRRHTRVIIHSTPATLSSLRDRLSLSSSCLLIIYLSPNQPLFVIRIVEPGRPGVLQSAACKCLQLGWRMK